MGAVELIRPIQVKDKRLSAVSTEMNFQLPQDAGHILITRGGICFSLMAVRCGIGQSPIDAAPYPGRKEGESGTAARV